MKEVKLVLTKNEDGIIAANESEGVIEFFDESDLSRKSFIKYLLEEFINKEVDGGRKYQ